MHFPNQKIIAILENNTRRLVMTIPNLDSVPQMYHEFLLHFTQKAIAQLQAHGSAQNQILIGNTTTRRLVTVEPDVSSDEAKDTTSWRVKGLVMMEDADFVITIFDSWVLDEKHAVNADQIMQQYGSIGASPYKISALTVGLETAQGIWMGICHIKDSKKSSLKAATADFELKKMDSSNGRFAGFLRKTPTSSTVH
jgi:hypothetical protein